MTPELSRYIRLARNHIYGTPMDEEDEKHAVALDEFKQFLAMKIDFGVRIELFANTNWQGGPEGCSLQFTVDAQRFVLAEKGKQYELFQERQSKMALLLTLADSKDFQDRLLIAIDDALQRSEASDPG